MVGGDGQGDNVHNCLSLFSLTRPECFYPMNQLWQISGVHLKYSGWESKEVCPYPWKTPRQTSDSIALCKHPLLRDLASVWQPWNSTCLLCLDFSKASNVTGYAAHLGICLPLQSPSCVRILHDPCVCFFDLEKTSFEPDAVAHACNPSTQEVEAGWFIKCSEQSNN